MIIFKDLNQAEACSKTILELRKLLKINPEFKFSKTRDAVKDKFFELVCEYHFEVMALVVDKVQIYSQTLQNSTDFFYNYFLKSLLAYDNNLLQNASIKIDGSGDKESKKALTAYLRRSIGQHRIKKFKFSNSKNDSLIQLADMVVGAIGRSYNKNRADSNRWLNTLQARGKISKIWDFK